MTAPDQPVRLEAGARVRAQRVFWHWRQTAGEVIEVDRHLGAALVRFDNGRIGWVANAILEPAPAR